MSDEETKVEMTNEQRLMRIASGQAQMCAALGRLAGIFDPTASAVLMGAYVSFIAAIEGDEKAREIMEETVEEATGVNLGDFGALKDAGMSPEEALKALRPKEAEEAADGGN